MGVKKESSLPEPASPPRMVGTTTISSATGAAFGTYLAILVVQLFGLDEVLDVQGVQALSGVLAIVCGVVGGWIAPPPRQGAYRGKHSSGSAPDTSSAIL